MSTGVELLRLLEPAVRPGGLRGSVAAPAQPIESRSFDSILDEARSITQARPAAEATSATEAKTADPLKALARVDLIDNAALLKFIGGERADSPRIASL